MEVYTRQQVDERLQAFHDKLQQLCSEVAELKANQSEWVTQTEACRLSGRSRSWFEKRRTLGTLLIAMQPRTADNGRIFFSRADCVKYAQKHLLAPPPSLV